MSRQTTALSVTSLARGRGLARDYHPVLSSPPCLVVPQSPGCPGSRTACALWICRRATLLALRQAHVAVTTILTVWVQLCPGRVCPNSHEQMNTNWKTEFLSALAKHKTASPAMVRKLEAQSLEQSRWSQAYLRIRKYEPHRLGEIIDDLRRAAADRQWGR